MSDQTTTGNVYTPRNILITGGAGFIASHVVILLVQKYPQYKIVNFDLLDYCSSLKNLAEIEKSPNYKFVKGNLLSADLLNYIMKSEQIDTVMHFAAQSHVDNSFGNSFTFTETNVLGTHVLLEAARANEIKRFIHISTDEVYGEIAATDDNAIEEKVLEPTNPYAASKAAAEFIVKGYHRSFKLPTIITRGNNVYGPHQFPEKVIPKFILRLKRGLPCCIHGNGHNTRNYLFVKDVAKAFETILHKGQVGEIYNIGTDFEMNNIGVAKSLIDLMNLKDRESELIIFVEDRKYNDQRYAIDSNKLKQLGWKPEVTWDQGLKQTVEWYHQYENNWEEVEHVLVPHPKRF
jgi:UDP-glucose 4,6-dehydratase